MEENTRRALEEAKIRLKTILRYEDDKDLVIEAEEGLKAIEAALSSPHPEAREEEIAKVRLLIEDAQDLLQPDRDIPCDDQAWHQLEKARDTLSRLAAQKDEGQTLTVEQVGWLRMVLGRSLYRVEHFPEQSNDEDIEADELAAAIILLGGEPAAPEPRPAEEPFATSKDSLQVEPAPTPSEEAIDHELVAYGRFAVALWRCSEHPGGMDWVEAVAKMLREHDAALRSQLARKDETLEELVEEAIGTVEATFVAHGWWSSWAARARSALREPDGRKGE